MWREILLDDVVGLQKHVDYYNDMACNKDDNKTVSFELIQKIISTKTECHCYFYEDADRQIILLYKYDALEDRIVIFQHFDNIALEKIILLPVEKSWDIYREKIRIIARRHSKIVRIGKLPDSVLSNPEFEKVWGTKSQRPQLIIDKFTEWGIKAIEFERYWEYELL